MKKWRFFAFFSKLSKVIGHLFCNFAPDLADGAFFSRIVRAAGSTAEPSQSANKAWSYKKNRAGSKKSKAYLSPKTAARHLRRLLKRRRKLEATDRLLCEKLRQIQERIDVIQSGLKPS